MTNRTFSLVLVSFKRCQELLNLLKDLRSQKFQVKTHWEIIAVLQSYTDEEVVQIKMALPPVPSRVICLEDAVGIHRSRNIALKYASGDLIAFLDDDCRISEDWIEVIRESFSAFDAIGGVGGYVRHPERSRSRFGWFIRFCGADTKTYKIDWGGMHSSPVNDFPHGVLEADWLSGGNMCFTKQAVAEAGEFDESYGMYGFDDVDYSLRVRRLGYRLVVNQRATVDHFPSKKGRKNFAEHFSEEEVRRVMFAQKALAGRPAWKLRYSLRFLRRLPLVIALAVSRKSFKLVILSVYKTAQTLKNLK